MLDHGLGNTKSNSKSSVPYFTSNEAILKCQGYLRVELYLFERVLVIIITCLGGWFGIHCPSAFLKIFTWVTDLSPKWSEPNMWLMINHTKPTSTLYWNLYLLTAGNYKPASGQLQNNSVNGAVLITISSVIRNRDDLWETGRKTSNYRDNEK